MKEVSKRCLVSGEVQGVSFRASTVERARRLGVTGWVKNLADGCVEVVACGGEQAVDDLCAWLWEGPARAEVEDVRCEPADVEAPEDFKAVS
jgi:acylphosphatase